MTLPADRSSIAWRRYLAALPDVQPPEALWLRLRAAHASPARARWPWLAATAAAVLVAVLLWPLRESRAPLSRAAPAMAVAAPAVEPSLVDAGLRRLDDELTLAYARNADETELAALWQTRERLIESLQGPTPAVLARL